MSCNSIIAIDIKNECSSVNYYVRSKIYIDQQGNVYNEDKIMIGCHAKFDELSGSVRFENLPTDKE